MEYDLIVAGGGPSGCMAAIAAARLGLKVLIIEKNSYLGGSNTSMMVCPLMAFHSGKRQIVKGIAQEVVDELVKRHASFGHVIDPIEEASTITPIDPFQLRLVYFEMMENEKNITILLNSFIVGTKTTKGKIESVSVVNKDGMMPYSAKRYIDSTGDGDVAALSHVGYEMGRKTDSLVQPMTLIFKMGGVNYERIINYMEKNPEQFVMNENADLHKYLAVSGFFDLVKTAQDAGDFDLPRDRVLFFQGINPGEVYVNTTRIIRRNGTSARDLTEANIEANHQVDVLQKFFRKYIPGFEKSYIASIADQIGVRETRRIHCIKTLTVQDVYDEKADPHSIAVCAYPIDIHDPNGSDLVWIRVKKYFCYDIPYEVMVPGKIENLIVTGRCMNADNMALASARITPTVMAMGQAAGVAAYVSIQSKKAFEDTSVSKIQSVLKKQGAVVSKVEKS